MVISLYDVKTEPRMARILANFCKRYEKRCERGRFNSSIVFSVYVDKDGYLISVLCPSRHDGFFDYSRNFSDVVESDLFIEPCSFEKLKDYANTLEF